VKLDSTGVVVWQKAYEGSATSIRQTAEGGYIVAGASSPYGFGGNDALLLKLHSSGSINWQKTYGQGHNDYATCAQQIDDDGDGIKDDGYVMVGKTYSFGSGGIDSWVLKLNDSGMIYSCDVIGSGTATAYDTSASGDATLAGDFSDSCITDSTSITPLASAATIVNVCYPNPDDMDEDGIEGYQDNCPETPNGPDLGTCAEVIGDIVKGTGVICVIDDECENGETCQRNQEDCNSNGIGDVCECYADFDGDGNVYPSDLSVFLSEYGRTNCISNPPCYADFDGDGNVYPSDLSVFLREYGRTDCPVIP
jgi:hypothetical protein